MIKVVQVLRALWPFFVIGGCAYIVFGLGHSGWWFLFALGLIG